MDEIKVDYWEVAYALGRALGPNPDTGDWEHEDCFWAVVVQLDKAFPNLAWHNVMTDGPAKVSYEEAHGIPVPKKDPYVVSMKEQTIEEALGDKWEGPQHD